MLPKNTDVETTPPSAADVVYGCLEYRVRKCTPKMTPQRMRHVLQRFLKNMLSKANE